MKHKRPTVFIAATVILLAAVLIYIIVTLNCPTKARYKVLKSRTQL